MAKANDNIGIEDKPNAVASDQLAKEQAIENRLNESKLQKTNKQPQQESNETEEDNGKESEEEDETSQENQLGAQMAEKGADMAKQAAKMVAKEAVKKAAMSVAASIASAAAAFLAATIEIWLPAIIIIFCATLTYQYWQKHSWDPSLYWNAARGNYAELLNNAINDTNAYDPAPAPKSKETTNPKVQGGGSTPVPKETSEKYGS